MTPATLDELRASHDGDWLAAFTTFRASAGAVLGEASSLRQALPASPGLKRIASQARDAALADDSQAQAFFAAHFRAWRVGAPGGGFVTGYYEPVVRGSLVEAEGFRAPLLTRPVDLGARDPYPTRREIERRGGAAAIWLEDPVEVFFIQVQGSGRAILPDGRGVRLVYDGRNGRPYTSIGKLAVARGHIGADEMSLARLKGWLRANGLSPGQPGRELMRENDSYIFFRAEPVVDPALGPTGGAGRPLETLRAIAVDRAHWSYGTPFFLSADIPWRTGQAEPFARPMIALDTGSAILGPARADLYFGSGDLAGARAGDIRHPADFVVLLPQDEIPDGAP